MEEEAEAPLLFEWRDAMALHYQSIVKTWHSTAPCKNPQNHWRVGLQSAEELHACLTCTKAKSGSGAVQPSVPRDLAGVCSAAAWKGFYKHCNDNDLIFNESKWQKHKDNLFNWPHRRDAYTALHGDAPKPPHAQIMDIVSQIFMVTETEEAWIFAARMPPLPRYACLVQELQEAYWAKPANRVKRVKALLRQLHIDSLDSNDTAWSDKLKQVLREIEPLQ